MVKCPRCGFENGGNDYYCENCTYPLKDPESSSLRKKERDGWNISTGKKIAIVLGIIVIGLLLFSFIYNVSQPDNKSSLNVISAERNLQEGTSTPYQVNVIYNGSWVGKVGDPNYLQDVSGYQNNNYSLDCAAWDKVSVDIEKNDYSSNELKVQLLRDGKVVAENSTTDELGSVVINYN